MRKIQIKNNNTHNLSGKQIESQGKTCNCPDKTRVPLSPPERETTGRSSHIPSFGPCKLRAMFIYLLYILLVLCDKTQREAAQLKRDRS